MIVSRGLGLGGAGSLVAYGLTLRIIDETESSGGGVAGPFSRGPRFDFDDRDLLDIMPIIVEVLNREY
jgi:hypothetical protein